MLNTKTNTTWCARVLLVLVAMGFAVSAQAATIYNFTFDNSGTIVAGGTFATDGAAPADPGYELLSWITFDFVTGNSTGTVYTGPFTITQFALGAAYNPVTGAFVNHNHGGLYEDPGLLGAARFPISIKIDSGFSLRGRLVGDVMDSNTDFEEGLRPGGLAISPTTVPATVPEPTSMALLGTGLAGLVVRARRKKA